MEDIDGRSVVHKWSAHPKNVGLARAELRSVLESWWLSFLGDSATLVLSELMTRVVWSYTGRSGQIETRFVRVRGGVRIEVRSPLPDDVRKTGRGDLWGPGLLLVAGLSDRWGLADRGELGEVAWAALVPLRWERGGVVRG
ncbi:ATP-binding protein [Streptomyces sp. NPDC095613]|uniref:ATP-binding protein n=1 Tax=Streptomyces sp. NPDC095613 TaxID=3155540 RepID=UPI003331DEEC